MRFDRLLKTLRDRFKNPTRSNVTVVPYAGDVTITCAPATTPTLEVTTTPAPTADSRGVADDDAPTASDTDDAPTASDTDITRAPVTAEPAAGAGETQESEGGGDSNTGVIAGSVAGGVALLAIAGFAAYKLKSTPPPPSYDDLVGA